jgi:hypothetical protein
MLTAVTTVNVGIHVRSNQDGLKLNGTHQLLAYADDVNILGGSVHTVRENAEALLVATKEIGLIKLSTWLCLGIGMQGGVTATRCINKFKIQQLYVLSTLYLCVV